VGSMSAIEDNQDRNSNEDIADPNAAEFVRLKKELTEAIRARGKWAEGSAGVLSTLLLGISGPKTMSAFCAPEPPARQIQPHRTAD
jgi:hypothetical protein